jgi:hypothetical protein
MKNLLIAILLFSALGSVCAQEGKVVVAAKGVKRVKCNGVSYSTHVNYSWYYGNDYDECSNRAKQAVHSNYFGLDDVYTVFSRGNYVVIISTKILYAETPGCERFHYAVGIGADARTAWEKAKNDLPWDWKERDGYNVIVDQAIY